MVRSLRHWHAFRTSAHFLRSTGAGIFNTGQTPYEYMGMLAAVIPDACNDLQVITNHYVQVRYGTAIPTSDDQDAVNQSWQKVRKHKIKRPHTQSVQEQEENEHG